MYSKAALLMVNIAVAMSSVSAFAVINDLDKAQFNAEYKRVAGVYTGMISDIEKAKSGDQWDESYHKLQHFVSSPGSGKFANLALCAHLKTLKPSELEYVGGIIDSNMSAESLKSCRSELIGKIELAGTMGKEAYDVDSEMANIRPIQFEERTIDEARAMFSNQGFGDKEVMLTFDDGPRRKTTPIILDYLNRAGVKAAFFNTGSSATQFPEVAQRILSEGHILGSHTYYHTLMMGRETSRGKMAYNQFLSEMITGHLAIHATTGYIDPFFRFPNGCSNKNMARNVHELGLKNFRWSVDSQDWQFSRGEFESRRQNILKTFVMGLKASKNRGIILMHDIHQQTVDALPLILNYLSDNGFKVVLLKPSNRDIADSQNLPLISQGESYLSDKGMTFADVRPEAPIADAKGHTLYNLKFKTKVNFFEMFPQLTYSNVPTDPKANCDDR